MLSAVLGGLFVASRVVLAATGTEPPKIGPAPDWVVQTPWEFPESFSENPSGKDYLVIDEQVSVASEECYKHNVYQIVSKAGLQGGAQISLDFDPTYETLTLNRVDLVRKDGRSSKLEPSKIEVIQKEKELDRQIYNGKRSALLILEDVRIGDVIDLEFTFKGRNPVFDGKFTDYGSLAYALPVHDLRYRLLVPHGRKIAFKVLGAASVTPETRVTNDAVEMLWERKNVPLLEDEDDVPDSIFFYPFIDVSEFTSWDEVIKWAEPLYDTEGDPGPQVDQVIERVRSSGGTAEQQVIAALDFAQQEIRYLGVEMGAGSHKPSDPAEVLRRRFGDCKDKTRLLVTMLRRLGFDAAPALVNSWRREGTLQRLPSPAPFDHVIVSLHFDGKHYLLDPTMSYQRGNRLELRHVGRYGPYLRLAPGGPRGLEQAAPGPDDLRDTQIVHDFTVTGFDAPATMIVTTTAKGRAADGLRSYFANNANGEISRNYLNYYTRYYPGLRLRNPVGFGDDPGENIVTTVESYEVDGLFEKKEDGKLLRAQFDPPTIWDHARARNLTERQYPYAISRAVRVSEKIVVHLHKDWNVTASSVDVSDDAFHFSSSIALSEPRVVVMDYLWESRNDVIPQGRFTEFSGNISKARGEIGYYLTWRNNATDDAAKEKPAGPADDTSPAVASSETSVRPSVLNWPMVGLALGIVVSCGVIAFLLIRIKKAGSGLPPIIGADGIPVPEPPAVPAATPELKGLGGWLVFVAIGLFVRPCFLAYVIVTSRNAYFDAGTWARLTSPDSEVFRKHFSLVAPLEMAINVGLLVYSIALLFLFFRKSAMFPKVIQIFFLCSVGAGVFAVWGAWLLPSDPPDTGNVDILVRAVIGAAIWIPYFRLSERVRHTFTK